MAKMLSVNDYKRLPENKKAEYFGELVNKLIRRKYTQSAELAVLRQQATKPEEFAEYNDYAEACKVEAKNILGLEKQLAEVQGC